MSTFHIPLPEGAGGKPEVAPYSFTDLAQAWRDVSYQDDILNKIRIEISVEEAKLRSAREKETEAEARLSRLQTEFHKIAKNVKL